MNFLIITTFLFGSLAIGLSIANDRKLQTENFPLTLHWRIELDGQVEALSTSDERLIYVRTVKKFYVIDSWSGDILWSHHLIKQVIPQPAIESSGVVYLADGEMVYAFDLLTGSVKWQQSVPLPVANVRSASDTFVAVEIEPYIYILSAKDGSTSWSKADCSYGGIQAFIENNAVYIPCGYSASGQIRAFNLASGQKLWEVKTPFSIATVAYQGNMMYYSPDRDTIAAYDLLKREQEWQTRYHGEGFRQFKVIDDYLATVDEQLCLFDRSSGDAFWCTDNIPDPQNPVIINNKVYVFNAVQNQITALNITDAAKIGEISIRNFKLASSRNELMVSIDDLLVFGSGNIVFAFGD